MRKLNMGLMMALGLGLAVPSFSTAFAAGSKSKSEASEGAAPMSKDEAQKLSEHNKLRAEIKKVKYPAPKSTIVAHVKGIKADDKKWFSDTLPDKTYESADDVFSALGWEATPAPAAAK
jgi:hypothetical protein